MSFDITKVHFFLESLKENLQTKLSDFWREPAKKNKIEVEKRKLSENENDSIAKRRCTKTDSNSSEVADNPLEKVVSSDVGSNVSSDSSKQIQKPLKVLTDDETIGIIRWVGLELFKIFPFCFI